MSVDIRKGEVQAAVYSCFSKFGMIFRAKSDLYFKATPVVETYYCRF